MLLTGTNVLDCVFLALESIIESEALLPITHKKSAE